MNIQYATTTEDLTRCFGVMKELRQNHNLKSFRTAMDGGNSKRRLLLGFWYSNKLADADNYLKHAVTNRSSIKFITMWKR